MKFGQNGSIGPTSESHVQLRSVRVLVKAGGWRADP